MSSLVPHTSYSIDGLAVHGVLKSSFQLTTAEKLVIRHRDIHLQSSCMHSKNIATTFKKLGKGRHVGVHERNYVHLRTMCA